MAAMLDKDQHADVAEFRRRVADMLPEFKNDFRRHDLNLGKFLIARDFQMDKAEEMLRKTMEWRRLHNANDILERRLSPELQKYLGFSFTGFDRCGRPVVLAQLGGWDPLKVVQIGLREDGRDMLIQFCERMYDLCAEISSESQMITNYFLIIDLENFGYRQLTSKEVLGLLRECVQILVNNYPENMFTIRILNAPRIFQVTWAFIKPVMTARTLSKIQILGSKKEEWKNHLLEYIDEDNLPSQYGGANTTCMTGNKLTIEDGLVSAVTLELLSEEELLTRFIEAGRCLSVEICADVGERIVWNFKTEDNDIGFKVEYENSDPVIPLCRVDSHKYLQKGVLVCEFSGKYQITFDNSYSRMTGKKLKYAIRSKGSGCLSIS